MRNGVSFLKRPSAFLIDKSKFIRKNFNNITTLLNERKIQCDNVSVCSSFIFLLISLAIITSLIFASCVAGIAIILCLFVLLIT